MFHFVAPIAAIGLFFKGEWWGGFSIILGLIFTYGMRFYGIWLLTHIEKRMSEEYIKSENVIDVESLPSVNENLQDTDDDPSKSRINELSDNLKEKYSAGLIDESMGLCCEILNINPEHKTTLAYYGRCFFKKGDYKKSVEFLSLCLKSEDTVLFVWKFRGDSYYKMGEYKKALADYREGFRVDPSNWAALCSIAECLFWLEDFDNAYKSIDQCISIELTCDVPMARKAQFLELQGRITEAIVQYKVTLDRFPAGESSEYAKNRLIELYLLDKEPDNEIWVRMDSNELGGHTTRFMKGDEIIGEVVCDSGKNVIDRQGISITRIMHETYPSGAIKCTMRFVDGLIDGMCTKYYSNGLIEREQTFLQGKMCGVDRQYYPSGQIEIERWYHDHQQHGSDKQYYTNGNLKYEAVYENGKICGIVRRYYENGILEQ